MLNKIYPWVLYLHILQLEEYNMVRFINWLFKNPIPKNIENKKQLIWTTKVKNILILSIIYLLTTLTIIIKNSNNVILQAIVLLILPVIPVPFIFLAVITLKPYEYINRIRIKRLIKKKIKYLKTKGLIVIGITGSYGKTTTKEFLYELMKTKYKVLKTPESYNTLFGLYNVINLELTEEYKFFICEMGAYKIGEIKELCQCILPDHCILTGINEQHIERFGSINNTIKAKFELIQAIPQKGIKILNIDNINIKSSYKNYINDPILYGETSENYSIKNIKYNNNGTSLDLVINNKKYKLSNLKIIGIGNLLNMLAGIIMSNKMKIPMPKIIQVAEQLKPVKHRLEMLSVNEDILIIDDTYSSNVEGFKNAISFLANFKDRKKIIVTPGIVELGKYENIIHEELGKEVNTTCDYIICVGKSKRTKHLTKHIQKEKILFINSIKDFKDTVKKLNAGKCVVLLENDLPDQY